MDRETRQEPRTLPGGVPLLRATCGHVDTLGALTGRPCGKCVRDAHRRAVGK